MKTQEEKHTEQETMNIFYFSFGWGHAHSVDGFTYDRDIIVEIRATDYGSAREIMVKYFSDKWASQYEEKPDMSYFPRGIKKLK